MVFGTDTTALVSRADFYDKQFSLVEYRQQLDALVQNLAVNKKQYLSVEGREFKFIGLVMRIFQVVKGKLGLTDFTEVTRVNSELLKFLYYGAAHDFMSEKAVFENVQRLASLKQSQKTAWLNNAVHEVATEIVTSIQKNTAYLPSIRKTIVAFHDENEEKLQPNILVRLFTQRIPRKECRSFGETYLFLVGQLMDNAGSGWLSRVRLFTIVDYFGRMAELKVTEEAYLKKMGDCLLKFCSNSFRAIFSYPSRVAKIKQVFLHLFWATFADANYLAAKNYAQSAIKYFPRDIEVMKCLGTVLLRLRDYQGASPYLSVLSDAHFSNPEELALVAMAYVAIGDKKGAVQSYTRAISVCAEEHQKMAPEKLAALHAQLGEVFAAEWGGENPDMLSAINHFQLAHNLSPKNADFKQRLFEVYIKAGSKNPSFYGAAGDLDKEANGPHVNYLIKDLEGRKQYQMAIEYYQRMNKLWPQGRFVIAAATYLHRGEELERNGNVKQALRAYKEACVRDPKSKEIRYAICRVKCKKAVSQSDVLLKRDALTKALHGTNFEFTDHIVADPYFSDPVTLSLIGDFLKSEKKSGKAIQVKEMALALYEERAKTLSEGQDKQQVLKAQSALHREVGESYYQRKYFGFELPDLTRAIQHFEDAFQLTPNETIRDQLFRYYIEGGKSYYKKAQQICPDRFDKHVNPLIHEYEANGQFHEAITYYEAVKKRSPEEHVVISIDSYLHRGEAFEAKGEIEKALGDFEKAVSLDPRNMAIHHAMCRVLYKRAKAKGSLTEKEQQLVRALETGRRVKEASREKIDPLIREITEALFEVRVALGKEQELLCQYKPYLTEEEIGRFIVEHQDAAREVVKWYDKALELRQDSPVLHFQKAEHLNFFQLDPLQAIKSYEEAVRLDSDNPFYNFRLAEVYSFNGDQKKFTENRKKALEHAPEGFGITFIHWYDERFCEQKIYNINPHNAETKKTFGGFIKFLLGLRKKN
jgi:tetratricopeptide (TPR) repeat protein